VVAAGQDKDQDKDKDTGTDKNKVKVAPKNSKKAASTYAKVEGALRCDPPETQHSIEVPDRPGHVLMIEKRKCKWTEPLEVAGAKTTDGVAVSFSEQMEGSLHSHAFEVGGMDDGETVTLHINGQIMGEKGPATAKGRWNFMRGTGKFKGIKGVGTYEGKLGADGVLTLELEGLYDPSEMVAGKK
jgi:hypothetical protein